MNTSAYDHDRHAALVRVTPIVVAGCGVIILSLA